MYISINYELGRIADMLAFGYLKYFQGFKKAFSLRYGFRVTTTCFEARHLMAESQQILIISGTPNLRYTNFCWLS